MENSYKAVRLDNEDNVVIACCDIPSGGYIESENLTVTEDIPKGHKISTAIIHKGDAVRKYNTVIGYAIDNYKPGKHMHNDEIEFRPRDAAKDFCVDYKPVDVKPLQDRKTFMGYERENGKAGTRNIVAVIALSNCAATVAKKIAASFPKSSLHKYRNVDAVCSFVHILGCGMEKAGSIPMTYLRRALVGCMNNPNVGGILLVSLGCERNNLSDFLKDPMVSCTVPLESIVIQENGGTASSIKQGCKSVEKLLEKADKTCRTNQPVSKLTIGLQCGGSDSFSSITSNPLIGKTMDKLIENGGTACLSETTEVFSAEGTLVKRARTPEVAQKLLDSIKWWKEYAKGKQIQINGEVTPGNNAGGLTNILEKALGSVKKGGSTCLNECYDYAEKIDCNGLVFMNAPSYDPVSATAQYAGGCNLCIFTTGRGSAYGAEYFPTIKIASNTELAEKMSGDIDFNAGVIIDNGIKLDELSDVLLEEIISVASGKVTKSEQLEMGSEEFIPWAIGVTG